MVQKCKVSSVNSAAGTAKVTLPNKDNIVSADLQIMRYRLQGSTEDTIQVVETGNVVIVAFFNDNYSDGVILGKVIT